MKIYVLCGIFVIIAVTAFAQSSGGSYVDQNAKIMYNEANYLVFEDVGRIEYKNAAGKVQGTTFGRYVRLHIYRDGEQCDIDLANPPYTENDYPLNLLIKPDVKVLKYKDKDNIWVIARQGHLGDEAILFNIVTKEVLVRYGGNDFELSPNMGMVAYYYSYGKDQHYVVFVNDMMVYPNIMGPFLWKMFSVPKTKEGVPFNEITKNYPTCDIETPIVWKNADTVEFAVKEKVDKTSETQSLKYVVSGLSSRDTSVTLQNIHVQKNLIVK